MLPCVTAAVVSKDWLRVDIALLQLDPRSGRIGGSVSGCASFPWHMGALIDVLDSALVRALSRLMVPPHIACKAFVLASVIVAQALGQDLAGNFKSGGYRRQQPSPRGPSRAHGGRCWPK